MIDLNVNVNSSIAVTPHSDSLVMNEELALLGEKLGEFKAYDSQLAIPEITGTRIVKCLYQKSTKTGEKLRDNSYVRVPTKHLTEEYIVSKIADLSPYVLTWLQGLEDSMIKKSHAKGSLSVYTPSLSLDKIVDMLEESEAGARLNKEKIEAWFTEYLEISLADKFALKLGINESSTDEELMRLELVLNAYKAKFASLAGGKAFIKEEDCIAMIAVISSVEEARESLLGRRFISRLEGMKTKTDELLLSL